MLETVQRDFNAKTILRGDLSLFTITESGAVSDKTLFHGLGVVPTEVLISQGHGNITFDFTTATSTTINYTTTGATTVRCLIGRL